ncbi:hypothetical protein L7F22_004083 [Adiantum nelumboides]|nr:hypothetical protein [Adiantum nelumboides]
MLLPCVGAFHNFARLTHRPPLPHRRLHKPWCLGEAQQDLEAVVAEGIVPIKKFLHKGALGRAVEADKIDKRAMMSLVAHLEVESPHKWLAMWLAADCGVEGSSDARLWVIHDVGDLRGALEEFKSEGMEEAVRGWDFGLGSGVVGAAHRKDVARRRRPGVGGGMQTVRGERDGAAISEPLHPLAVLSRNEIICSFHWSSQPSWQQQEPGEEEGEDGAEVAACER